MTRPELTYTPQGTSRLFLCPDCGLLVLRSRAKEHARLDCPKRAPNSKLLRLVPP